MFKGNTILVTGGTGSFGKKFISIILKEHNPKKVIIFSRDELKQSEMRKSELYNKYKKKLRFFIGDIRDYDRLNTSFENVDIVVQLTWWSFLSHTVIAAMVCWNFRAVSRITKGT